uniref:NAD-dependent epimerase/dehydratase domain-containing protein n=1 Tax=Nelumbo nucifera TaxID=4432 RepID=A0A822ZR38_NELNU|nr:TPA_asm: hypothetical protein HUJ06_016896 [Nelumbo nucifera]
MELYGATLSWTSSISLPIHIAQPPSIWGIKRFRLFCLNNIKNVSDETQKDNRMVVSITGATGFIGKRLVQRLHADNHRICVLTRSKSKAQLVFPGKSQGIPGNFNCRGT